MAFINKFIKLLVYLLLDFIISEYLNAHITSLGSGFGYFSDNILG